ncbi:MAG: hypothetical protein KF729_30065 [Sandaracinaceae bacterium]|nr:hypothetical protein [Sandaracinaceae bacterium]
MRPLTARALALLALFAAGCGMFGAPVVRRTVGGEARTGAWVSPYSYEHFLRAELAEQHGDLRAAADGYRRARAGPEDDPLVVSRLADVLDRLGREAEAAQLLAEAAERWPDDESVHLARGRLHERHDRLDEAGEAYARAAHAAPRSEAGPLALAALLRRRDRGADADRKALLAARAPAPRAPRLALAGRPRQPAHSAAEAVRASFEAAPARADEVRGAAHTALEAGQPELALRLFAALPDPTEDRGLRLRAMLEARRPDLAEGLLAEWMPGEADALVEVAEGYLAIGAPARALELGRVALAQDGGPLARLVVGRALAAEATPAEPPRACSRVRPEPRGARRSPLAGIVGAGPPRARRRGSSPARARAAPIIATRPRAGAARRRRRGRRAARAETPCPRSPPRARARSTGSVRRRRRRRLPRARRRRPSGARARPPAGAGRARARGRRARARASALGRARRARPRGGRRAPPPRGARRVKHRLDGALDFVTDRHAGYTARSKRSAFITFVHAATKSCTSFSLPSSCAYSSA